MINNNNKITCCGTAPFVYGVSPLEPGPSSAAPQWCQAFSSSCTVHDCPCTKPGCVCWCANAGRKIQNPAKSGCFQLPNRNSIFFVGFSIYDIKNKLTGAFLSIGFMTNFLSLKEMFRISLQGKPIFGVNLKNKYSRKHEFTLWKLLI